MILLHPANFLDWRPTLDLMSQYRIVPGAYSPLKPLWADAGRTELLNTTEMIAQERGCKEEQVLLRWCHYKK